MIRTEIRFKNAGFINALNKKGYKSIVEFSKKAGISYGQIIEYANLRRIPKDPHHRKVICDLLETDEWTLFEQYKEVLDKTKGKNKPIIKDIPIENIVSLDSEEVLQLESDTEIDKTINNDFLNIELNKKLDTLKIKEKDVLKMYFGIDGYSGNGKTGGLSLEEISNKLSLSRERVRQIKNKALRRMRHRCRSDKLRTYRDTFDKVYHCKLNASHRLEKLNDYLVDTALFKNKIVYPYYNDSEIAKIKNSILLGNLSYLYKRYGLKINNIDMIIKSLGRHIYICYECLSNNIEISYTERLKRGIKWLILPLESKSIEASLPLYIGAGNLCL